MKLHHAFVATTETVTLGTSSDDIRHVNFDAGWYTPPVFRRRRLHRFGPLARRVMWLRALWRWSARYPPPPYGDWLASTEGSVTHE